MLRMNGNTGPWKPQKRHVPKLLGYKDRLNYSMVQAPGGSAGVFYLQQLPMLLFCTENAAACRIFSLVPPSGIAAKEMDQKTPWIRKNPDRKDAGCQAWVVNWKLPASTSCTLPSGRWMTAGTGTVMSYWT